MNFEEIKKTNVVPKEEETKNLLEYDSNKQKTTSKPIVFDNRYDMFNVSPFDKIKDSSLLLRPAFPWEDEDSFVKKAQQTDKEGFKPTDESTENVVIVKTTKKIVRRKAKVKSAKDIASIVQASSFSHIPMGRPPSAIYGGGVGGVDSGMYTYSGTSKYTASSAEREATKATVSKILKNAGLTKAQAAGIMGNMQVESGFNVMALNKSDGWTKAPSIGLVQYNGLSYVGTRDAEKMFNVIGRTADAQVKYLLNTPKCKRYITKSSPYPTNPSECCFLFAKYFEGCSICTSREKFSGKGGRTRTAYALGFYEKFSDSSSPLFWG